MRFGEPRLLWATVMVLPLLAAFLVWSWRSKQKLIRQFVQSRLLANLTVGVSHRRQKLRLVLLFIAVAVLLVALARPQAGFRWEQSRQQGLDIVVAIDTSRSMLAQDVLPNRLLRAKLAALDLLRLARTDRLGLVAFAGTAFLQCPLTLDEEAFRQNVQAMNVGIIPQGGSDLSGAIEAALGAFEKGNDNHKVLILFTDGEDHESGAIVAAQKAAKAGLRIFTLGVGTREGELIRAPDANGKMDFVRDDGNVVKSRLNEDLLRKIAEAAHGFYLPLQGANSLNLLYARGLSPLPRTESLTPFRRVYREQYHWLVLAGMAFLVFEVFMPQRRRVTRSAAMMAASTTAPLRGAVTLILGGMLFHAQASPSSAMRDYQAGKFPEALREFDRLLEKKTDDHRLFFNAGAAAYRGQRWDEAESRFAGALNSPNLELQEKAYYNLGNTLFQSGDHNPDPAQKQKAWEQALEHFQSALTLATNHVDARYNRDFVQRKIEELKRQQEQQKQPPSNDDPKKDKDQQQNQKEDQPPKDQKSDEKKDSQSKANEKEKGDKQPEKKPSGEGEKEKQKEQEAKGGNADKDRKDQQQQAQNGGQPKSDEKDRPPQTATGSASLGTMTEKEAQQFLDAFRQSEKPLIFAPQADPRKGSRTIKDW